MRTGLDLGSMPRFRPPPVWCSEFESVGVEIIADSSCDGIALPFPAPLARNAPLIERPCDSCSRHSVMVNLPSHVVNEDGMLEPNWYEQDLIDWMDWQIEDNGMSAAAVVRSLNSRGITGKRGGQWQGQSVKRTIGHTFHENRADFPHTSHWGTMPWHR